MTLYTYSALMQYTIGAARSIATCKSCHQNLWERPVNKVERRNGR